MNEQQILQQLHDLHLPNAISNWPPAPGWYLLLLLILLSIILVWRTIRRSVHRQRAKRAALSELATLQELAGPQTFATLSVLLKRVALAYYPHTQVASLYGIDWLKFLDDTSRGMTDFQQHAGLLINAPYQKFNDHAPVEQELVFDLAKTWIKQQGRS